MTKIINKQTINLSVEDIENIIKKHIESKFRTEDKFDVEDCVITFNIKSSGFNNVSSYEGVAMGGHTTPTLDSVTITTIKEVDL